MNQGPHELHSELHLLRAKLAQANQTISRLQNTTSSPSDHARSPSVASGSQTGTNPFAHDGMPRSNTVPIQRRPIRHNENYHAVKRMRTMSQQAPTAQKMDRMTLSARSEGPFNNPFTMNAPVSPPRKARNHVVRSNWDHASKSPHELHTVSETGPSSNSVMLDPAEFLAGHQFLDESFCSGSFDSSSILASQHIDLDVPHLNLSVCGSMTSAPTYDTSPISAPMSRSTSQFDNSSVSGGMQMMNLGSQMSQPTGGECSPLGKRPYNYDEALNAVGSNLEPPYTHHQYPTSFTTDNLLSSADMERSISSTSMASAKSASSQKDRAKETLNQQIERANKAKLMPRPAAENAGATSQANAKKDGKTAIKKQSYVRPKQPKVYCDQCQEHPEGFRGDHELRRHKDAKHQQRVKKFICVDPLTRGLSPGVEVVNPLAQCKWCNKQKKYGAYYNAAAHLRRTHFKKKPNRKTKNAPPRGDDDKRGGKGGGDWPPMSELKNWMTEVWVNPDEKDEDEDDGAKSQSVHGADGPVANTGLEDFDPSFTLHGNGDETNFSSFESFPGNTMTQHDPSYMANMPISSANFALPVSPTAMSNFGADLSSFASPDHIMHSHFSSNGSSCATITPQTPLNDHSPLSHEEYDFNAMMFAH